jgi:hypothetical protein
MYAAAYEIEHGGGKTTAGPGGMAARLLQFGANLAGAPGKA